MDQDDPENRIAELERQLAEQKRDANLPPASPDHAVPPRSFVAYPEPWGTKTAARVNKMSAKRRYTGFFATVVAMMAAVIGGSFLLAHVGPGFWSFLADHRTFFYPIPFLAPLAAFGMFLYIRWYNRRKILLCVTSDGLTIDTRPGDVFSCGDAKLGIWAGAMTAGMTAGSVLHLQSGRHVFLVGGRDHRIANGTQLDAPPADSVDAWMSASDFDQLLTLAGRRSGSDVRAPAPGGSTRCLLFANSEQFQRISPLALRDRLRLGRAVSAGQPLLAIDLGADAIGVIDPKNNALLASASVEQVTATPETYKYWMANWTSPVLVVCVPGWQPITIACLDRADQAPDSLSWQGRVSGPRFSWRGNVQRVNTPAVYMTSGPDWFTLIEKFGLAPYLQDTTNTVQG